MQRSREMFDHIWRQSFKIGWLCLRHGELVEWRHFCQAFVSVSKIERITIWNINLLGKVISVGKFLAYIKRYQEKNLDQQSKIPSYIKKTFRIPRL